MPKFQCFLKIVFLLFLSLFSWGCSPYRAQGPGFSGLSAGGAQCLDEKVQPKAIYGEDSRMDWWEVDGPLKYHWAAATVALIERGNMEFTTDGYILSGPKHGPSKNLCDGTPYREQPEVAFCSGFLVAENLVVTAGHCVRTANDCRSTQFVFDFAKTNESQVDFKVPIENVYRCRSVVKRELFLSDYALIELDRKVSDRTPLNIRREGQVEVGDELILIGHPSGLPSKIASGGTVFDSGRQIFAGVDAFAGNSGSALINKKNGIVEGILVAGELDYIENGSCNSEFRCDGRCEGEIITPISDIADSIPNKIYDTPAVTCF